MFIVGLFNTKKKKKKICASHHVGAFLEPGERERRVSSPFTVQGDVRVDVDCFGLRLHQQDGTDWRESRKHKETFFVVLK